MKKRWQERWKIQKRNCSQKLWKRRLELRRVGTEAKDLLTDQSGVSTVEIILILVVLIALVLIFKDQIISLVNNVMDKVTSQGQSV